MELNHDKTQFNRCMIQASAVSDILSRINLFFGDAKSISDFFCVDLTILCRIECETVTNSSNVNLQLRSTTNSNFACFAFQHSKDVTGNSTTSFSNYSHREDFFGTCFTARFGELDSFVSVSFVLIFEKLPAGKH